MKIQNQNPSFGRIIKSPNMTTEMYKTIMKTPAVKKFAKKFNAKMSIEQFYSSKSPQKLQMGLRFANIESKNIFSRIKQAAKGIATAKTILLKTHSVDEEGLIKSLSHTEPKALLNIYKKA